MGDYSDFENMSLHPEECCEEPVTMDNKCPGNEKQTMLPEPCPEATMKDGTCCGWVYARFDYSDFENVSNHPEECCEGPVTMNKECPEVSLAGKKKRNKRKRKGKKKRKNTNEGDESQDSEEALPECTCPSYQTGAILGTEMCQFGDNCALGSNFDSCPPNAVHCVLTRTTEEPSESHSDTYSVLEQGRDVVIPAFAFLGAISLIWHGACAFHKTCVKSEFTPIQQEAEC